MSDISNPTKPWDLCKYWTDLLFVEFFSQGDQEKSLKLPVSQFMDRETTNIAKGQIGFIDFIIKPIYAAGHSFLPKLQVNINNIDANKDKWQNKFDEYEEKMKKLNVNEELIKEFLE